MRDKNSKRIILHFSLSFCILAFVFCIPGVASAATLYFSPSSGEYTIGKTFSVSVYVSSSDQSINAASGVISFPKEKLEVISLSKVGSVFNLWVQEPSFSNSNGTINFEGIVLNPGFTGASGKILTLTFRVKSAGSALINFSSGSVLANDGQGTNILTNLGSAQFSLNDNTPYVPETTVPSIPIGTPTAPQISSPTHPDPNKWYNNSNPKFVWQVPNDIIAVKILYDKYPNSFPSVLYTSPISEKQLENIKDGVWYFHIQFKNNNGWGAVSHFRFQIDTEPPVPFSIKFIDGKETRNPRPTIVFDTIDSLSGIDYYKIKIGEGDFFAANSEIVKSNPYTLPLQAPGKRSILIQAYDKAGNYTTAFEEFIIKPIEAPEIIDYPSELQPGNIFSIKGTALPETRIKIYIQKDEKGVEIGETRSDIEGNWVYVSAKPVKNGVYQIWAEAIDSFGAQSQPSSKIKILVTPPLFLKIGKLMIDYLTIIVILLVLVLLLIFGIFWFLILIKRRKKKLEKKLSGTERAIHRAFRILKEEIERQVANLDDNSELSEKEKRIYEDLKKALEISEKFISKEIDDIEKEIK